MKRRGHLEFAFRPDLRLVVTGDAVALRHFRAEYGPAAAETTSHPDVEIVSARHVDPSQSVVAGGHKTVRWQVALSPPDTSHLRAVLALRGRPRSFALSLVQGYFVEPLLALAATHRGYVLLPAAAVQEREGAVLLIGRSRSGKSSVCARALAAGRTVLGDDHVLLDAHGNCYPFPRRMRFYSDLRTTAPGAYAALPFATRLGLLSRGALRALTRGYVAPPVRVAPDQLGRASAPRPLRLERIIVVERDVESNGAKGASADERPQLALASALEALTEQRQQLREALRGGWGEMLEATRRVEESLLSQAFRDRPVERVVIPDAWSAAQAVSALAGRLGLGA
jgi:hypothetical protein